MAVMVVMLAILSGVLEVVKTSIVVEDDPEIRNEEAEDIGECAWIYDWRWEFEKEEQLPYADEKTFQVIKDAYADIDFYGEFKKGNLDVYDDYKKKFQKLVQNEVTFLDKETGEKVCIADREQWYQEYDEYEYYFFDMDEDGAPELGIKRLDAFYIFKYDDETEEYSLWYSMEGEWYALIGSRKIMWLGDGAYLDYWQLDQNGEIECETFFSRNPMSTDNPCMVMMPEYANGEKEVVLTEEMKKQGVFVRNTGQWYFRVTQEQYEELIENYMDAYYSSWESREEVTFDYEELFGSITIETGDGGECEKAYDYWTEFAEEKRLPYASEETFQVIKEAYDNIDYYGEFEEGNLKVYDDYKLKFGKVVRGEVPFLDEEKGKEIYLKDIDEDWAYDIGIYYFFDMDGDGMPELGTNIAGYLYVFKYDFDMDAYTVWWLSERIGDELIGSRKVMWMGERNYRYHAYCQLDGNGEMECEAFFFHKWNFSDIPYMVMMPEYANEDREVVITEEMKAQGVFERNSGQWYFRVTKEQYDVLEEAYQEAHYLQLKKRDKVTYTYEELFGSLATETQNLQEKVVMLK